MRLQIENVSKSFQGVQALAGVSLSIEPGEIHALMGENGAGKSTLIKIITGVIRPDTGAVLLNGEPVVFRSPRDASSAGIAVVHQERNLIPRFTVAENITLERPPVTMRGWVDFDAARQRARQALGLLDPTIDVDRQVRTLSVAQMQMVEIAKALSIEAKVLLLDEPTASLTDHETSALVDVLRRLRANGVAIVFVSHKLGEVMSLSDRVSVLRDGRVVAQGAPIAEMSRGQLVSAMIGREERIAHIDRSSGVGAIAIELKQVSTSLGHEGLSLSLRAGEILGLYGLVGAGRTELARALVGVGEVTGGAVYVRGEPSPAVRNPHEAFKQRRIGYVSEDRKGDGLILAHSVRTNVAITIWRRLASTIGLVSRQAEIRAAAPYIDRLAIKIASPESPVASLSGGNQQKVSIAKWLAAETDILILDEPSVGVDVKTKVELHELIGELANRGLAVLVISSDLPEIITVADRILVMHEFSIVSEVANDHVYDTMSKIIMNDIHRAKTHG